MRKTLLFSLLLLPAFVWAATPAQLRSALAFTHVTVIDATGAAAQPDMTVVVTGNRITALGKTGQVSLPQGAQVVQASGKFLIPGLWDMHAHAAFTAFTMDQRVPLLLANGVTGMRDMGGSLDLLKQWRREIAAGTRLGPRIVAAGPIVDGPGSRFPNSKMAGSTASAALGSQFFTIVSTAAAGRQTVDALKKEGADFVKVYSFLPREAYFAIADEAKQQHIPFAGHVPERVTVAEASNAGQKSIEHLTGMMLATSTREDELMRTFNQEVARIPIEQSDYSMAVFKLSSRLEASGIESYSEPKASGLFARLRKNGTWQCPTLTVLRSIAFSGDTSVNDLNDPRLKYIPTTTLKGWNPSGDSPFKRTAEEIAIAKKTYSKQVELVDALQRAGVGILSGTDMGNPYCFPGFSSHDELELLVKAGLTPMQALQTATVNPARYLGREQELGTIGVGKLADLVLLDADPLIDIGNTKKIHAVVLDGRLLERAELDTMLAEAATLAQRKP